MLDDISRHLFLNLAICRFSFRVNSTRFSATNLVSMPFGSLILRRLPYGFPLISNSGAFRLVDCSENEQRRSKLPPLRAPACEFRPLDFVYLPPEFSRWEAFSRYSSMAYCSCIFGRRLRSSCLDATHGFSKSLCFCGGLAQGLSRKAQIHILEPFLFIAAFLRDCPFLATAVNIHISDFRSWLICSPIH